MAHLRRAAFTPFAPERMYALVNDVERYPEFLPWCADARVLAHREQAMTARLTVRKGRFDHAFTTENTLTPDRLIELRLVEGPFRKFRGEWRFDAADGGCLVTFDIEFDFSGRLLGRALTAAFSPIADSMVDAFRQRAHALYDG